MPERHDKATPEQTAEYVRALKAKGQWESMSLMLAPEPMVVIVLGREPPGLRELIATEPEDADHLTGWVVVKDSVELEPENVWLCLEIDWPGYAHVDLIFNARQDHAALEVIAKTEELGLAVSKEDMHNLQFIVLQDIKTDEPRALLRALRAKNARS